MKNEKTTSESYIYTLVDKKRLEELLESFYVCIGLTIQVLDENGDMILRHGPTWNYCRHFSEHLRTGADCRSIHSRAGKTAMEIGEAYIFSCNSNLSHIAFPLINAEKLYGSVLVGPFLMDEAESSLVLNVGHHYPEFSMSNLMELYDDAAEIPVIEPNKVTQISRLLYFLFSNLLSEGKEQFVINNNRFHQQARISETIHMYKNQEYVAEQSYPFDKEQELADRIKEGNASEARRVLNEILGYVFVSAGTNLEVVKNRVVELCSMISRTAIASGALDSRVLNINNHLISELGRYNTLDSLCHGVEEVLYAYLDSIFPAVSVGNTLAVRDAINYISRHFNEDIKLKDITEIVHLNENYFSRLFRQSTGKTFREYLTCIRIDEARRLLKNTEYSIMDISLAVGYDNQSYFTRVFKQETGMTPIQYRK